MDIPLGLPILLITELLEALAAVLAWGSEMGKEIAWVVVEILFDSRPAYSKAA